MQLQGLRMKTFLSIAMTVSVVSASKILKMPKIYNALITSKEKILPSEAYPAATGPIFQPIGLYGAPVLIQPEIDNSELFKVKEGDRVKVSFEKKPFTFFPRYSVYYPNQPHFLIQYPFLYGPLEDSHLADGFPADNKSEQIDEELENEEKKDLFFQRSKHEPHSGEVIMEYVKNNRPLNREIPDVPPLPPPIRFKNFERSTFHSQN